MSSRTRWTASPSCERGSGSASRTGRVPCSERRGRARTPASWWSATRSDRWCHRASPWDRISGALDYYDLPGAADKRQVTNERDRDATTLLMAHVEYWEDPLLPRVLAETLTTA